MENSIEQQPSSFSVPVDNVTAASMGLAKLEKHFDKVAKSRGMKRVGNIELYPDGAEVGIRALVVEV